MASKSKYMKEINKPDEHRNFQDHGYLDVLRFDDGSTVGRGIFTPGWRWSNDVKPIAGTESCQKSHTGYCLKGSMKIRMDNGDEFQVKAGEAFRFPAGHDAWVEGGETCEMLDFTGCSDYALKQV